MTKIDLGTFGALEVDTSRFTDRVNDYIFAYGLKQVLNDAHASVTKKAFPDLTDDERNANKEALAVKKLESLYAGNVAQARQSRGDAVARMAFQLAEAAVLAKLPQIGKKRGDFKTAVWNAVVGKQLDAKRDDYMARAKAALGEPDESDDFDLADLIDDDETDDESDETEKSGDE